MRLIAERRFGELALQLERADKREAGSLGGDVKAGNVAPASVAGARSPYAQAIADAGGSVPHAGKSDEGEGRAGSIPHRLPKTT